MKRIIVTGAGGSASYNFIESLRLADEDFYVIGTDMNKEHLELSNADKKYIVPPVTDPSYIDKINKIIEKEKIEFLHPQPDVEVGFISENRDKINAKTLLPAKETIRICHDKMRLNLILRGKGINAPNSFLIKKKKSIQTSIDELKKDNEKFWLRAIKGAGSRASIPVKEYAHAAMWIDYWSKMRNIGYGEFMISEFLPGKEFAFQSLWKDGEIITSQVRERLEYVFGNLTVSGQSSSPSIAKTVAREDVNETATKAIKTIDLNATGIFCVDLKENNKGVPCVTEINPGRFFTTSDFFSHAGLNMPYYFIKMGLGEKIPLLAKYNSLSEGLYWVRLMDCGKKLVKEGKWTSSEV